MQTKGYFITGIDTGVGKTIVSAILTESLKADYWKPIQAGDLENSDTMKVKELVSNEKTVFHPETYLLKTPMSPHAAADIDGIQINLDEINVPDTKNTLIIEGAGGIMVPLTNKLMMLDLMKKLNLPVIVVSKNYLGSINHTLMTISCLKAKGLEIAGLVFNGEPNVTSEKVILEYSGLDVLCRIPVLEQVDVGEVCKLDDVLMR